MIAVGALSPCRGAFRLRLRGPCQNGGRLPGRHDRCRRGVFRSRAARLDHDQQRRPEPVRYGHPASTKGTPAVPHATLPGGQAPRWPRPRIPRPVPALRRPRSRDCQPTGPIVRRLDGDCAPRREGLDGRRVDRAAHRGRLSQVAWRGGSSTGRRSARPASRSARTLGGGRRQHRLDDARQRAGPDAIRRRGRGLRPRGRHGPAGDGRAVHPARRVALGDRERPLPGAAPARGVAAARRRPRPRQACGDDRDHRVGSGVRRRGADREGRDPGAAGGEDPVREADQMYILIKL